jgi:AcrR family transcriptional regulator
MNAMTARGKSPARTGPLVWEQPEPISRPAPAALSRDRIVRTAIAIADKGGLDAVSLRKIGAALDAGPMRLYGYVSTKEELLELMVDAVYGEMASAEPLNPDWREALRAIAHRTRRAAQKHGWFIDLLSNRPPVGPNALAHLEASLSALGQTRGFENIDDVMQVVGTVNAYVVGAIRSEAGELLAEHKSGMDQKKWQAATWPYLQRMLATGRFPTLERVVRDATHPPADVVFDRGLDCVIAGIEAKFPR